jgi:hypothetical protein
LFKKQGSSFYHPPTLAIIAEGESSRSQENGHFRLTETAWKDSF